MSEAFSVIRDDLSWLGRMIGRCTLILLSLTLLVLIWTYPKSKYQNQDYTCEVIATFGGQPNLVMTPELKRIVHTIEKCEPHLLTPEVAHVKFVFANVTLPEASDDVRCKLCYRGRTVYEYTTRSICNVVIPTFEKIDTSVRFSE